MTKSRGILIRGNDEARFYSHVTVGDIADGMTTPCWVWTGAPARGGYAQFQTSNAGVKKANAVHRWAYENAVGPIPEGYQIDHLCKVRTCVNVEHLEAVPGPVNNARSDSPSAVNARRVMCAAGLHELAGDNLATSPSRVARGVRRCRPCLNDYQRRKRTAKENA